MEVKLCSLYFKLILYNLLNNYFKVFYNIKNTILNCVFNIINCIISQTDNPLQSYSRSLKSLCFKTFSGLLWYSKPRNHGKDDSGGFLTLIDTTEQN